MLNNDIAPEPCLLHTDKLAPEQLSDAILRGTVFMVIAVNDQGIVTFFNAAAEQEIGYSAAEIVGKHTPEIWHDPEEIRQYAAELSAKLGLPITPGFEAIIKKTRMYGAEDREWTFIRKNGSRFPVLLSVVTIKDKQGRVVGFLGLIRDITMLKVQQRAAINHEIFLDAVVRHIADGLITTNDKGIAQHYNPACEELFGYKAAEVIGKNISMLMAEPDRSKHNIYLGRYLRSGEGKTRQRQARDSGAAQGWLRFFRSISPLPNLKSTAT